MLALAEKALSRISSPWDANTAECGALDFKETPETAGESGTSARRRFREMLAETAVCFANAEGGAIVLGVRNKAETRDLALPGVPQSYSGEDLAAIVFSQTSPAITPRPHQLDIDGKRIIVLVVPTGSGVHSTSSGVYKIRVADRCMPLEGDSLRGLRALREHYDWTAEASPFGVEGLSTAALERAALLLRRTGQDDLADMIDRNAHDFLGATRLLAEGRVTRAGILLYGTAYALQESVPHWGINIQTRQTPGSEPTILMRREAADVPLVLLLDQLITLAGALARVQTIRVGAEQVELVDYPPDALREIIANAFAHRDWEAPGIVEIVHSPDELIVTSPGGLLPTLKIDRLLHDAAAPRNRLLADNMARLRLAEMSGLGLDRAFREISRMGKEPPIMENGPRFRVALPGGRGDESFARFIHGPSFPALLAGDVDILMALTAFRHTKSVTAPRLSSRLQRNLADTERVLRRMQENGLVQPTRGTARRAHPNYTLAPSTVAGMRSAVTYRVTSVDSDDQKLLRHLRRHERISNEDVRNYLDCDIATARNRLTRLRKRGLIDFAPDSPRRGPNVVYIGTPKALSVEDVRAPDSPAPDSR